jgi:glyoxylase-like metal-dependent hydrolase (beta-lactamase superfamily II)
MIMKTLRTIITTKTTTAALALSLCAVGLGSRAGAQMGDPTKVTLKTTPVVGGISVIEGANGFSGGNVGVSVGDDGVLVIDDALQPLAPKLRTALAALSKKPVRFVVNTHVHMDHTGGNEMLGTAGAVIVAHYNVRKRLSADQFVEFLGQKHTIPASPAVALPVVTFNDDLTFFFNGDEIEVLHVAPAHTDGDAIVHFKKANVIHTGDVFVAHYPIVDSSSGGTYEGHIAAADRILALADDSTKIIPGHGPVSTKADVQAFRDMVVKVRDKVAALAAQKKTLDEIKAAKPTAEYDAKYGQGFIKPDMLVEMAYKAIPTAPPAKAAGKKKH